MNKKTYRLFTATFIVAVTLLSLHFFNISMIHSRKLTKMAHNQYISTESVKQWRGCIYDCNMIPLTDRNIDTVTTPTEQSVPVYNRYDSDSVAKHVLGYNYSDSSGAAGMEKSFDSLLSTDTSQQIAYITDGAGNSLSKIFDMSNSSFMPDENLKLTIDYKIQKIAESCAESMIAKGSIVILDCRNFDIKAMVSKPSYDQNNISNSLYANDASLMNKALCPYNAGSIFKIITAAAALESNLSLSDPAICTGAENIDGKTFLCHKVDGHGIVDFGTAFAQSCNCYYYKLGQQCGGMAIIDMAKKFGLGTPLCTDILCDSPGTLPQRSEYSPRECANLSIGQGELLITPLQAAYMTAIIANNGIGQTINIADSIVTPHGAPLRTLRKSGEKIVVSAQTAHRIGEMMHQCATSGTASSVYSSEISTAGKTGTAQTGWFSDGATMVHGWFCGYFPVENPQYAISVFCENGQSGSQSCIPTFKEIAEKIYTLYN